MLTATDLTVALGRATVLQDVSLTVNEGEAVALMGRNGAGKTTTLKTLAGLLAPKSGAVTFRGDPIHGRPPHRIARAGLGWVPEDRRVFADLTVAENLDVGRQPPRDDAPTWTDAALFDLFPVLGETRHRAAGTLSGGEQQMLAIARTLIGNPRLLLLDEPSEGLAPLVVEDVKRAVARVRDQGVAVLLSEQNQGFALDLADRAYVIEKGRIRWEGAADALAGDAELRHRFLAI